MTGSCPWSRSLSTTWEPMNPDPPVTRTLIGYQSCCCSWSTVVRGRSWQAAQTRRHKNSPTPASRGGSKAENGWSGGDDHGLDGRGDLVGHLDYDHVGPDVPDRLVEMDLAPVDPDPACFADRIRDVLGRHRAEQAAIVARLLRDRQHGPSEHGGVVAR